ncbi:MAG: HIT domain-containing protein, partial [Nanoarchaeota archaeon]|nr:HIT domain-containing protein [Nanoarchaeota archaeon]
MTITEEEANKIKEHLLGQLDNFPEDKRDEIENQINSMTTEQVETFIKQNNLTHLGGQCIFCSIIANQTPSYKIGEDAHSVAILELNPESKGHSLIIPKEHLEEIPQSTKILAQEIGKKLQDKLNPDEIEINELKIMNHSLLEIIPIFGERKEKRQATKEELKSLQEEILKKPEVKIEKKIEI